MKNTTTQRAELMTAINTLREQIRVYAGYITAGANLEKYASLIAYTNDLLNEAWQELEDYERDHPEENDGCFF